MRQTIRTLATTITLGLAAIAAAGAHEFWIEPSTFRPAAGEHVAVRLRVGEAFDGERVARSDERIVRFDLVGDTATPIPGRDGADPAGVVRAGEAAPQILAYESDHARIRIAARRFEAYLAAEGLERIIEERATRGESDAAGRERYARCAKALLIPRAAAGPPETDEAPRSVVDRAVGLTLELVAEADPSTLAPDAPLPLRLLFEGRPVEDALVRAWQRGSTAEPVRARTDRDGRVTMRLDGRGAWLVSSVHMTRSTRWDDADWASWWASLTFFRGAVD